MFSLNIVVDTSAGTFAAFYYKNIRQFDTPTKDHMVSYGQDEKFTVGGFDVSITEKKKFVLVVVIGTNFVYKFDLF